MYSTSPVLFSGLDVADNTDLLVQAYSSSFFPNTQKHQHSSWHRTDPSLIDDPLTDEEIPESAHSDSQSFSSSLSLCSVAHSSASSLSTTNSTYSPDNTSSNINTNLNTNNNKKNTQTLSTTNCNLDTSLNNSNIVKYFLSLNSDFTHLLGSCYSPSAQSNYDNLSFKSAESDFLSLSHPATLVPIISDLSKTMKDSLNDELSPTMLPSLLTSLPSGKEKGTFLSVDVGGSTLRVALVKLAGRNSVTPISVLHSKHYPITDAFKNSSGHDFFMWICNKIKDAVECANICTRLYMGLSWSFPFSQLEDISKGTILTMGKGYTITNEITGWDLNATFSKCFQLLGLDIKLTAIINDTIASLVSHSYFSKNTRAALISGTGSNASAILPMNKDGQVKQALVNTELSLLGGSIIPETKWDKIVDSEVEQPGFQPFETKVSGRYLGEISRLVIKEILGSEAAGFGDKYCFDTEIMSLAEGRFLEGEVCKSREILEAATGHEFSSDDEVEEVCRVFQAVSSRSAAYTATYLLALAQNFGTVTEGETISIAYSGTVVEKYPMYKERCQKFLDMFGELAGLTFKLKLEPALEGTLYGPAIASAMNLSL